MIDSCKEFCSLLSIERKARKAMLTLLKIKNLALVDRLTWNIDSGLVGVTGETGAGKSVIVGALKLILGERADKNLIRTGETQCVVEASFDCSSHKPCQAILAECGIEPQENGELIIKRAIGQRSNKQFVNHKPVVLSVLKKLGTQLVDLHGPHAHQSLLSSERQLAMLDAYAGCVQQCKTFSALFRQWKAKQQELKNLQQSGQEQEQKIDLWKYQIEEIEAAQLQPNEEQEIEARYKRALNSGKTQERAAKINQLLSGGVVEQLFEVQRLARDLERLDDRLTPSLKGLDSAVLEIEELEASMQQICQEIEIDPAELHQLEERINTFELLKRKYGTTLEEVLEHAEKTKEKLARIDNKEAIIQQLTADAAILMEKMEKIGETLGKKRKTAATKLAKNIATHLKDLGFKQAAFEVKLETLNSPEATGWQKINFHFGPNIGEPLKPLHLIASSGELSRVMLAVKSALAAQDEISLMVFDEIDANVGGEIARAVGEKMATLGQKHQVIAITHFPQVAAVASAHYRVEKREKQGRTTSELHLVKNEERIAELVRMLGGGTGKQAREMALSLLSDNSTK